MKLPYSEPKIFTGGVDINQWSKLSSKNKQEALQRDWYVYYSFRNPNTKKLVRQTNIKGNANFYTTMSNRMKVLKPIQRQLLHVLEAGFNPYREDNSQVIKVLRGETVSKLSNDLEGKKSNNSKVHKISNVEPAIAMSLQDALQLVLDTKKKVLNENSFPKFKSRINQFYTWLYANGFKKTDDITIVNKKTVIEYLNSVLQRTSPRNRNNSRNDISNFIGTLIDNDVFEDNFILKIKVLNAIPTRNKSYKPELLKNIKDYMQKNDPILSLFVDFVSYGFLRPIEVCRLKVEDLDLTFKKLYVRAKNQPVKEKIIPEKLLNKIPDLSKCKDSEFLFTPDKIGGNWQLAESYKRNYFSKRFKLVKEHFNLGTEYGLYSFRHTTTADIYRELEKDGTLTPHEIKSKLMLITGHSSMSALESYLRNINAKLPNDYSHLIKY